MRQIFGWLTVRNDDVQRLTNQPELTSIIQSRRLTLFGHIMCMDDNADANRILLASPPADWRKQLGRPHITWLSTVQKDLKQHHLTLPEAADLAQNRPLEDDVDVWRYAIVRVACQKRQRRTILVQLIVEDVVTCFFLRHSVDRVSAAVTPVIHHIQLISSDQGLLYQKLENTASCLCNELEIRTVGIENNSLFDTASVTDLQRHLTPQQNHNVCSGIECMHSISL